VASLGDQSGAATGRAKIASIGDHLRPFLTKQRDNIGAHKLLRVGHHNALSIETVRHDGFSYGTSNGLPEVNQPSAQKIFNAAAGCTTGRPSFP
jgi:hypothetical protein